MRGNTHSHTTASDGKFTVAELASWYEDHGYGFLCITDHDIVADISESNTSELVVISGAEIGLCWNQAMGAEICAIGINTVKRARVHPQEVVNDVLEQGGLPIVSHPHMSGVYSGLMMELQGLVGLEVFNAHCYGTGRRGFAVTHWDDLLTNGQQVWGFASDDRHSALSTGTDFAPGYDQAKAWIMVRSQQRTAESILQAIRQGMFYATTGPEIHDIAIVDEHIQVHCSPVQSVRLASLPWTGARMVAKGNQMLSEARFHIGAAGTPARLARSVKGFTESGFLSAPKSMPSYFRIELWDGNEGYAWSNPITISP